MHLVTFLLWSLWKQLATSLHHPNLVPIFFPLQLRTAATRYTVPTGPYRALATPTVILTTPTAHGWSWRQSITGYSWCSKALHWRRTSTSCPSTMGHPAPETWEHGKFLLYSFSRVLDLSLISQCYKVYSPDFSGKSSLDLVISSHTCHLSVMSLFSQSSSVIS